MASFYAELHLNGSIYPVWQCSYRCHQTTDARGRVRTKVRQGPLELVLDVPTDDGLLSWANTPHKPLAGQVVFYYLAEQVAHETIAFAAGECVDYTEQFEAGAQREGAYRCQLVITAPQFDMLAGGPAATVAAGDDRPTTQLGGALAAGAGLAGAAEASSGAALPTAAQAAGAAIPTPKAIAKDVNPSKGMQNCIPITQAVVARLRGTDPTATAPDVPFGNLESLEKAHGTTVEFGKDFSQVFDEMRAAGEGAIGVIVLLPLDGGMGHVVTITNHEGTPTIIEGQNWGPYHPAEANTSLARAERRYGDTTTHMIGLGMVPPLPAPPAAT